MLETVNRRHSALKVRELARLTLGALIVTLPVRARLVLAARPTPPVYGDYTDLLLFWSDVFLLATLSLWLLGLVLWPRRVRFGPAVLHWPLAALIGWGGVTAFFSVDALLSFYHVVRLILLAGLTLFVVNEIESVRQVIVPVALMVVTQSVIGVAQVLAQHDLGLAALGELRLDPQVRGVSVVFAGDLRFLRAYSLTDHPNLLGGCLAFALVLILAWRGSTATRWRTLWGGVFALGAVALYLTFSRTAWLAFGVGVLASAALYLYARQAHVLPDWASMAGAALLVVAPFVWQTAPYLGMRLDTQSSLLNRAPVAERAFLNDVTLRIFTQHPLTGVGLGALPLAQRAAFPDFPLNYQPAHFALLVAAAETGLPGAMAYVIALVAPWGALGLRGAWPRAPGRPLPPALIAACGALAAVTLVGFFDYYTWLLAPGRLWQWLLWGLWARSVDPERLLSETGT